MNSKELAQNVAQQLTRKHWRLVLAESCTAGLVAATLGRVPGISANLCGSAVVYREDTKVKWLGVTEALLTEHSAVSTQATAAIAKGVLDRTPEANLSLGITGHFGPEAPDGLDGVIYLAIWQRDIAATTEVGADRIQLEAASRNDRQSEAVTRALGFLLDKLSAG